MVTTRRGQLAAVQDGIQPTPATAPSDKKRSQRHRGRETAPEAIATSQRRVSRKRRRFTEDEQVNQPRRERSRLRYVLDEHADEVPDEDFFRKIEMTVLGEKKGVENEDMDAERQLLQESQSRMSNNEEEAEGEDSDGEEPDDEQAEVEAEDVNEEEGSEEPQQEDDEQGEEEQDEEEQDEEEQDEEEQDEEEQDEEEQDEEEQDEEEQDEEEQDEEEQDEDVEENKNTHQGSEFRRGSSQTGLQVITSISISTGMDFVHPEGTTLYTSSVSCDIFNALVPYMGKRGWTGLKRDWARELLPLDEESDVQWTVRHGDILRSRHMYLFKETLGLREICRVMPRAQNLNAQTRFLRENASHINTTLTNIGTLVQEMEQQAKQPAQKTTKKNKANQRISMKILAECICKRLIPLLVLALKESVLLGGSSMLSPEHDTISTQGNTFMACTLQFAIRIVGFIEGLYSVVEDYIDAHRPPEKESGDKSAMGQRERAEHQNRKTFGHHLSALRTHLLSGMLEIQQLANEPTRNKEAAERDKHIREQRERNAVQIQEAQARQMNLFWESITPGPYNQKRMRDGYYRKHGWQLWEDETLLGSIRRERKPDLEDLAQRLPKRTLSEVTQRVREIKTLQKAKYKAMNKVPPKWCY